MKGYVVFTIDMLSLPTERANKYCKDMKDKFQNSKLKPNDWEFIIRPTRHKGDKIEVFFINEDGSEEEILPFIYENEKLIKKMPETPETVKEYVKIMLGEPVVSLSEDVVNMIDSLTEKAFRYNVNNKKQFVYDEINEFNHNKY